MTNDRARKRAIRAYAKEHGLNYTEAMRQLEQQDTSGEKDRPVATCPDCGGPVYYDLDCHTWSNSQGKWVACLPCDSAIRYECQHGDCEWGYVDGLNPRNPRSADNARRRPDWLTDWELFDDSPLDMARAYPGVLFVMDADLGDDR